MERKKLRNVQDRVINLILVPLKILTVTKSNTVREAKLINFISSSLTIITRPFLKKILNVDWKKTSDFVEKKYDELSGSYIEIYKDSKRANVANFNYVDNVIRKVSNFEQDKNQLNERYNIISQYKFKNILEVGAGELTKLSLMANLIGENVDYYALDLSLNRVYQGRKDFLKEHQCKLFVCKANAAALPYPDNSFDMVFTAHCLEHMPYDYKKAIDEMCRVARKVVILFEPSYELGTFSQKIRMKAQDYVKGIPQHIKSIKNAQLVKHFFLRNSSIFNRTACHIIEIKKSPEETKEFNYSCPSCKTKLRQDNSSLFCPDCEKIFFIFEGIPILDNKYSFYIGNKYQKS